MIRGLVSAVLITAMIVPVHALAQEEPAAQSDMDKKLAEMEKRFQEEIDSLKADTEKNKEETENLKFELESMSQESGAENLDTNIPFTVYGFFDLSYMHLLTAKDSMLSLYVPTNPSFLMSNVNLFFLSQMTDSLSALLELRFSFLPHGQPASNEVIIYRDDASAEGGVSETQGGEFTRVSTRVTDPFTSQLYYQGGITIERVHLTYSPFDWLQVIAGRFLTPYGIWNIDHGSPVVLPVRVPYMQIREMVPLAQTGLQVFGRVYPTDELSFDYAVTLSNGRGPMEQVYDLDRNKGVGVRLRFDYRGSKVRVAVGGYGYFGSATATKSVILLDYTEDAAQPAKVETEVVDKYDEYIVSADLLIEFYRIRIQSEYVFRYVDYEESGAIGAAELALKNLPPTRTFYWSSYVGNDVYALLSYELPLDQWINPVRIAPYFMYEYGDPQDNWQEIAFNTFLVGLNVKLNPYVVLKAEYSYAIPKSDTAYAENPQNFSAQVAVSF